MNNKDLIEEFSRWLSAGRPDVFFKDKDGWGVTNEPGWVEDVVYIVDDKHAEMRRKLIDNPNLIVELYDEVANIWVTIDYPKFDVNLKYRIKPEEPEYKIVYEWMYKLDNKDWIITDHLYTEEQAKTRFSGYTYQKTGREFKVEK